MLISIGHFGLVCGKATTVLGQIHYLQRAANEKFGSKLGKDTVAKIIVESAKIATMDVDAACEYMERMIAEDEHSDKS